MQSWSSEEVSLYIYPICAVKTFFIRMKRRQAIRTFDNSYPPLVTSKGEYRFYVIVF